MKEQENSSEELDEMEASNLSDREFRVMIIIKILNSMKKDIGPVRNKEWNIWNDTLEGINSRLDKAEDQISDLKLFAMPGFILQDFT